MRIKIPFESYFRCLTHRKSGTPIARKPLGSVAKADERLQENNKPANSGPPEAVRLETTCNDEAYFSFTRGRFIVNERYEMSQRHVRYNIHELGCVAAKAMGAQSCTHVEKFPDGLYNKALLLHMDDGSQVVAKIPNPNAGRPHFTTASEVATMEFVRETLGTPVPRVHAWSSHADESAVGAEFIIMEKVDGVQLATVWEDMPVEDRFTIAKGIADYQATWTSCNFNQYGSLYYREDLDGDVPSFSYQDENSGTVADQRYAVGPSTAREYYDDGRSSVDLDRGPWSSAEEHLRAIGHREISCVQNVSKLPQSLISLFGPGTYRPTREKKLRALGCYLELLPYLLPTDSSINSSCLWHDDLHVENIFVDPKEPTRIVSIIDWQATALAPLFENARQPNLLNHEGSRLRRLERPDWPENLEKMDLATQKRVTDLYFKKSLAALYKFLMHQQNPRFYRAMAFQETFSFDLILFARNLLLDGEAHYLGRVAELATSWAELPGVREKGNPVYPLSFSQEDILCIEADVLAAGLGMQAMREVRDNLGGLLLETGMVRHHQYKDVMASLRQSKEQIISRFSKDEEDRKIWEESWPFDD